MKPDGPIKLRLADDRGADLIRGAHTTLDSDPVRQQWETKR